ncbi:MAG: FAD-dependent oxidoreductase [Paracoccus sp. (in: a-proteobacteria)]|nr:FAD-dependent oxidoreductase [Paracoccus sp. (in: a-proteobacteria)]
MASDQITVVGAGIAGLAAAWELLRRGASVRVIEARAPGAGASGGTVGALAPHAPENWNAKKEAQLRSLLAQPRFWAEVAEASGRDPLYGGAGRVQPLADRAALERARARVEAAAAHWPAEKRMWLSRDAGGLALGSASGWYLHDNLTARIAPRAAIAALSASITARGGEIVTGTPAPGDMPAPVIWATGAEGLAALSADLGRAVGKGVKGQSALLGYDAKDAPQVFADGLHIVPHGDGTIAIGSTSETEFDDPASVDGQLDDLIAKARAICPQLAAAPVIDRWAGLRPRARSRAPLIGPWPGRAGHFVLNGGFKIGFGMAPVMAGWAADLVLEGKADLPKGFSVAEI